MTEFYFSPAGYTTATPTANTQRIASPIEKFIAIVFITLAALMSGKKGWEVTAAQYTMAATSPVLFLVLY